MGYGAKPLLDATNPGRLLLITADADAFGWSPLEAAWPKIENGPVPHAFRNEPGTESYIFGELENVQAGDIKNGMVAIVESYSTLAHLRTHLTAVKAKMDPDATWNSMWIPSDAGFFFKSSSKL